MRKDIKLKELEKIQQKYVERDFYDLRVEFKMLEEVWDRAIECYKKENEK